MIKKLVIIFMLSVSVVYAQSDISDVHQKILPPNSARYDIVQSEIAAKWTFRLDRYYGKVAKLVRTSNGGNAWKNMRIVDLPKITNSEKPRFLIFTSGIASRHTYMLDTVTGKTWTLTTATIPLEEGKTTKIDYWSPFKN